MAQPKRDAAGRRVFFIPKITVEGWRRAWYEKAYLEAKKADRNLNFSTWVRQVLDRASAELLPNVQPERLRPPQWQPGRHGPGTRAKS